ncbi:unnamed protein product [Caenorhabditis sp. 36 PRJEB53466]|nr:unnamed protein product [Caenorhabditis sp. 36 PRJEB53466]
MRNEKRTWLVEHEARKFKHHHNTSLFLTLQSSGPEMTSLCLKGWCDTADDVFVIPYQYVNWRLKHTEQWIIQHFSKMLYHAKRLPQQAQWYMFAFDNNYIFVEKLINELGVFDPHLPIYTILRDFKADFSHKPVLVFSRFALNSFWDQAGEKCDFNIENVEDWLTSCMSVPPMKMSVDRNNKSRIFAIKRHFEVDELYKMPIGYHDDKEYIHSHSSSLLSFTNLSTSDLKLLPIFVEKVIGGSSRAENAKNMRINK